jgi:hypothetical protein
MRSFLSYKQQGNSLGMMRGDAAACSTPDGNWRSKTELESILQTLFSKLKIPSVSIDTPKDLTITSIFWLALNHVAFKDGIIQGFYQNLHGNNPKMKAVRNDTEIRMMEKVSLNHDAKDANDSFIIIGGRVNDIDSSYTVNPDIGLDESFTEVYFPWLLVSPFVNAVFVICLKKDTDAPVLIKNCMSVNTELIRKSYGIPEYMVIPCKEGEAIELTDTSIDDFKDITW